MAGQAAPVDISPSVKEQQSPHPPHSEERSRELRSECCDNYGGKCGVETQTCSEMKQEARKRKVFGSARTLWRKKREIFLTFCSCPGLEIPWRRVLIIVLKTPTDCTQNKPLFVSLSSFSFYKPRFRVSLRKRFAPPRAVTARSVDHRSQQ